ncbi:MAG: guanylate kinase [Caulobacteraceae bacterium]
MSSEGGVSRGLMLVISSPSGAGKTSLSRRLLMDHPKLQLSISCTTRPPRAGEKEGREYHFVDHAQFKRMVADDAFLEWAEVHENCYGSPRAPAMAALEAGKDVLFDIDWQGARQVALLGGDDVVRVFVLPPSMGELRRRLYARAEDAHDVIERRLARAKGEIAHWDEYDYVVVNEDFDRAYASISHIYYAAKSRRMRPGLGDVVTRIMDEPV